MKLVYPYPVLCGLFIGISLLFSTHVCFAGPGEGRTVESRIGAGRTGRTLFAQTPAVGLDGWDGTVTTNTALFALASPSGTTATNVESSGFDITAFATGNVSMFMNPFGGYGTPNPSTAANCFVRTQRTATTTTLTETDINSNDGSVFNLQSLAVYATSAAGDVIQFQVSGWRSGSQVGSTVTTTGASGTESWVLVTTNFTGIDKIKIVETDITNGTDIAQSGVDALDLTGLSVTNPALTNAQAGVAYRAENFTASGGSSPYTFSKVSGSLPAGMTLSGTGALSGIPTQVGTFSFSVQATDATGQTSAASSATLTVTPPTLTLSPTSLPDGTYESSYTPAVTFSGSGGNAPFTYSAVGLPPGMTINASTGVLSGTPTHAGTYAIAITAQDATTGTGSPYVVTNNITWVIDKAPLTITANGATKVYGAALPVFTVNYSGFVGTDDKNSLSTAPSITTTATAASPVGSYPITASAAVDPNYAITYVAATLQVTPAALTITPAPANMVYGGAVPALSANYSGFVNSDNAASLTTPPTLNTTATSSSLPGTYPISAGGAMDPNYTITYNTGVLTVNKATLTVTANDTLMPLGGPLPPLTLRYSGFIGNDNLSSLTTRPTASTTATAGSPSGTYPITPSGGSAANYTFNYVDGTLTVELATLTITALPAGSVYGSPLVPNGSLRVKYSGFINGDNSSSLTVPPTITNTCTAGAPAGTYRLIPSAAVDPYYNIVYVDTTYTVTPAPLQISGTAETRTYGSANPALTASYTGFVNGDAASSLTTLPTLTTTATASSPVGTYPITPSGAADPNYTITYSDGTLTVGPVPLTITAGSGSMTYGGTVPTLGATYSGFVNNDNASALTTQATVSTTATSSSPLGSYPTTATGAVDPNYTFTYVPGVLTVGPAALTVMAYPETKVYGTPDPVLQYTVSGLVNGDNTNIFTGSLTRAPGETVGTYPITRGTLSAGSNYTLSFTGNNFVITRATQQISWTQPLLAGCNGATQLQLTATSSSGLPVTYASSDTAVALVAGDVVTLGQAGSALITASQPGDSNYLPATPVTDTAINQAASLVQVHWGNVLIFDNTSSDYTQWQWYKNGSAIAGATGQYYSETPSLNGQYYVIATNNAGAQVQTCPLAVTSGSAAPGGISVFPNPVNRGGSVTIVSNYTAAALEGARMQILDMGGMIYQQITNVQPSMQVAMPSGGGIYIINLQLSNGQKASVNVLVGQ